MSLDLIIRPAEKGDEAAILATFAHAFTDRRNRDIWRWLYHDNPDGSQSMICVSSEGRVLAHSGASFHRAVHAGSIVKIGQGRDSFSHPAYRSVVRGHKGLFALTAQALFNTWGPGEGVAFYYGFPSRQAWRLGAKQLDYRAGANWCRLHKHLQTPSVSVGAPCGMLSEKKHFGEEFDALWQERAKEMATAVIHDSNFLNWRFHPRSQRSYWVWTFKPHLSPQISAYVIFSRRGAEAMLLDFHLPGNSRENQAFWSLIMEKLRWNKIERIETWFSRNHPDLSRLLEVGFEEIPLPEDIRFGFRIFDTGPDLPLLDEQFCFSMADSDLF
jgi:hypothetical protein